MQCLNISRKRNGGDNTIFLEGTDWTLSQSPTLISGAHRFRLAICLSVKCKYFLAHQFKHMFWELKRTVLFRWFYEMVLLSTHNICFG